MHMRKADQWDKSARVPSTCMYLPLLERSREVRRREKWNGEETIRHNVLSAEADEFDSVGIVVQRFIAKREFHVHHKKEVPGKAGRQSREGVEKQRGGTKGEDLIQAENENPDTHLSHTTLPNRNPTLIGS